MSEIALATPNGSSTLEHSAGPPPTNTSAEGLFYSACEAATDATKAGLRHTDSILRALQSTMALVEFGKECADDLEALLHYHKSRKRKGLDVFGRVVKLVFPHAGAPLRNCYANALRHVARQGKSAEELPALLRNTGIEKAAREEVKASGKGKGATQATTSASIAVPCKLPDNLNGKTVKVRKTEGGKWVVELAAPRPRT